MKSSASQRLRHGNPLLLENNGGIGKAEAKISLHSDISRGRRHTAQRSWLDLNYKLEVELAKVSCGFQHPQNYAKWHYAHNLVCFSGQVVAVCNIDFYHRIGTSTPNVTSFKCNEPLFD
ncbi:hypothetical protein MTO96_042895 [Rhipicephalus appendiculatus]